MDGNPPELDGGFFIASFPFKPEFWTVWILGAMLFSIGFFLNPTFAFLGLFLLLITTPHPFKQELESIKKESLDSTKLAKIAEEQGYSSEKYWMPESLDGLKNGMGEWHFPAPSKHVWNWKNPYAGDKSGTLVCEHPFMVGAPRAALFTLRSVYFFLGLVTLIYWGSIDVVKYHLETIYVLFSFLIEFTDSEALGFLFGLGLVLFVVYWVIRFVRHLISSVSNLQMIDMQTSLVRSVAVGEAEMVGQVRPGPHAALKLFVDDDPRKSCENIVVYEWVREDFPEDGPLSDYHNVMVMAGVGIFRFFKGIITAFRKEFLTHSYETSRQSGGVPFMLHDGSGGIRIEPSQFKRIIYQDPVQVWDVGFTRWTLYALRLGDPIYVHAEVTMREEEETELEGLDGTVGHSMLKVVGHTDTPGQSLVLMQGTEYSQLAYSYSMMENLYFPLFCLVLFFIL